MIQGTDEWLDSRVGLFTASRISDLMMKPESAGYKNYIAEKVAERLTGKDASSDYTSPAMERGSELEEQARVLYEIVTGKTVEQTGLVIHPEIPSLGASPDGLVEDGLVEIKCRNLANHINIILTGKVDRKAMIQMQSQMMCVGAEWCDYVNYHPDMPPELQLHVIRVEADNDLQGQIKEAVLNANDEVNRVLSELSTSH